MSTAESELIFIEPNEQLRTLPRRIARARFADFATRAVGGLVAVNLLCMLVRPQYSISILGQSRMVLIMSVLPLPFLALRCREAATAQTKAMAALLVYGALMVPFVRNNYWAFHTWRDIAQSFLCFLFPIVVFLSYGRLLRRMTNTLVFIGLYLGVYSILHSGRGPGAFLGDENDNGLALVMLAALPLFLFQYARGPAAKLFYLASGFSILGGIVATGSRGSFLGMIVLGLFYFIKSQQKGAVIAVMFVCTVCGIFLVPATYWARISTIQQTDQGTALARRVMWKRSFRIFLDPRHTLTGVGMENTRYHINEYETASDFSEINRSFAGRQVHSMYLQLLADLGLIGVAILGFCIVSTFRENRACLKNLRTQRARLPGLSEQLDAVAAELSSKSETGDDVDRRYEIEALQRTPALLADEYRYLSVLISAFSAALAASLVSAAFISVLYYPVIWLLFAVSAAARRYYHRLISVVEDESLPRLPLAAV